MDATPSNRTAGTQEAKPLSRAGLDAGELEQLLGAAAPHLRALGGAHLLITGATGWFGVWLLDFLSFADDRLKLELRITAVSREPQRFLARFPAFAAAPRLTWVKADIRRLEAGSGGYSHVIHAATDSSLKPGIEAPPPLFDTIVDGTRRALAAAGPACRSFLLLSSGAIYGPARDGSARFAESDLGGPDPSAPASGYAEGKRAAEQICAIAAARGVPTRIARCFAFVGPHMPFDQHFAIGNFIADAAAGRPILVKSDGRPERSYMYMTDLIGALLAILAAGTVGRPYNVGSEVTYTIEQVARCVDRVMGGRGVVMGGAASDPRDRYVPDTTRLRAELACAAGVALEDAIARTGQWYRAQPRDRMSS